MFSAYGPISTSVGSYKKSSECSSCNSAFRLQQAPHKRLPLRQLRQRRELVRLMHLVDVAGAADYRRNAGFFKQPAFGAVQLRPVGLVARD
jgi:hypothetical protein